MLKVDPAHGAKVKAPKSRSHHTWDRRGGLLERNSASPGFTVEAVPCRTEVEGLGPPHMHGRIRIDRLQAR